MDTRRSFGPFRRIGISRSARAVALLCALAPAAARATTQIDCDGTADFCTGDPCITADSLEITVSPCTLNFGAATLQIDKKVTIAVDGGTLSLTAGNIETNGKIDGKHVGAAASNGSDVTLTATGDITINRKIDVSSRSTPGSITLDAGGNIAIGHQLVARAKGRNASATGGTISIEADGTITSSKRGKLIVRGKKNSTDAGEVGVSGDLGVDLDGRIEARGLNAGTVAVTSPNGNVVFDEEIRAYGENDSGGRVFLDTPVGDVTMSGVVRASGAPGGLIDITGAVVDINRLNARGNGGTPGGSIVILGSTVTADRLLARGEVGGSISVITVVNPPGGVTISERLDVRGKTQGGTVNVSTPYDATITARLEARGDVGGTATFHADGNLTLGASNSTDYRADGPAGGTIEASTTTGNLTVRGEYQVQVGGCIGLSAGGILDTSMATFDTPPAASCP